MRYRCVDARKAAGCSVAAACTTAGVSTSAHYAWTVRARQGPSDRHRPRPGWSVRSAASTPDQVLMDAVADEVTGSVLRDHIPPTEPEPGHA
jgi:transposase